MFCYNVQPGIEIDYATGDNKLAETAAEESTAEEASASDEGSITVVLNTNPDRKRIHVPGTHCASQIHAENYLEWTGTAKELNEYAKENDYIACGSCHPELKLGIELPTKNDKK